MASLVSAAGAAEDPDFKALFDGRSLAGWETPDPSYWSVEDGAITGRITAEHPCSVNQYLVWQGGDLADFELKLKSRVNGAGGINNGFQFRSRLLPDHDVCGYQVDNNLETPWLARLYDEYGRHTLAWRGERAAFDENGRRSVAKIAEAEGPAWFRLEEWHEYHLICSGERITLRIDGRLAAEVEDHDPRRSEPQGILALQLHSGPATVAQFKEIRLKVLKPAAPKPKLLVSAAGQERLALRQQATAWWPLDTGGHGARPRLAHIPAFEKFELNVRAAGPGARRGTDVVLLDGAYFDAGPDLQQAEEALTIYLRARDPLAAWNAGLFGKSGAEGEVYFKLSGVDLPETPGPDILFQVGTEAGVAAVSFPVSAIEGRAWHDLAGRYDGKKVELICDGRSMTAKAWMGRLLKNRGPLLVGAETKDGKVVRTFHGELEEAAIWGRALTAEELGVLSSWEGK